MDFTASSLDSEVQVASERSNLTVYLRIKPDPNFDELYEVENDEILTSKQLKTKEFERNGIHLSNSCRKYKFSKVYHISSTQETIFNDIVKPKIQKFVNNQNCSILMYGASGSGKTFTIIGTDKQPGLIPRALNYFFEYISIYDDHFNCILRPNGTVIPTSLQIKNDLFEKLVSNHSKEEHIKNFRAMKENLLYEDTFISDEESDASYSVWISFAEIYNEKIYDLLQPSNGRKQLHLRHVKNNYYIEGLTTVKVKSAIEAYLLLQTGLENLNYADTKINSHSSRSHAIFTIKLVKYVNLDNKSYAHVSAFNFCDLAGAERSKKTLNEGKRLEESNCINTSLLVLGKCIKNIREGQKKDSKRLVPFRESKLTQLLKNGLSGMEDISMIVNINPSKQMYNETQHVLKFSAIAQEIVLNHTDFINFQTFSNHLETQNNANSTNISKLNVDVNDLDLINEVDYLRRLAEQDKCVGPIIAAETKRDILLEALEERASLTKDYEHKLQKLHRKLRRDMELKLHNLQIDLKGLNDSVIVLSSDDEELDEEYSQEEEEEEEEQEVIIIDSSDESSEEPDDIFQTKCVLESDIKEHHLIITALKDELETLKRDKEQTSTKINELQNIIEKRNAEIKKLETEKNIELAQKSRETLMKYRDSLELKFYNLNINSPPINENDLFKFVK